jgi:hypothetical protein
MKRQAAAVDGTTYNVTSGTTTFHSPFTQGTATRRRR